MLETSISLALDVLIMSFNANIVDVFKIFKVQEKIKEKS